MTVTTQLRNSRVWEGLSNKEWELYDLINTLRSERGKNARITQQELADKLGVNKAMVSRYLRLLRIAGIVARDSSGASTVIVKRFRRKSA
jgi:uncharacterized membrane protein